MTEEIKGRECERERERLNENGMYRLNRKSERWIDREGRRQEKEWNDKQGDR